MNELWLFAVHCLADGRWELLGPDDDPYRPSWRRYAVVRAGSDLMAVLGINQGKACDLIERSSTGRGDDDRRTSAAAFT